MENVGLAALRFEVVKDLPDAGEGVDRVGMSAGFLGQGADAVEDDHLTETVILTGEQFQRLN